MKVKGEEEHSLAKRRDLIFRSRAEAGRGVLAGNVYAVHKTGEGI